jgi:hypothetical protein
MSGQSHSPLLLSPDEVQEITGFKLSRLQVGWLRRKGWRFEINAIGKPIVARKYAEKMLGCAEETATVLRPHFGALRAI